MKDTNWLDVTLLDVLEEGNVGLQEAVKIKDLLELPTLESLRTTHLRDLYADQFRTLAMMLGRSVDEIGNAGMNQTTTDEKELLRMWRGTDERGRALIMHVARTQQVYTAAEAPTTYDHS